MFTMLLMLVAALVLGVNAPALGASRAPAGIQETGQLPAPAATFQDEHGKRLSVKAFAGKVIVLNFWATWCAPCIKEMPSLERLSAQLPAENFVVVAISQDRGGVAVARPFLTKIKVNQLPIYVDPAGRVARDFGARGFPTTVIINGDGLIVARLEGGIEWDAFEIVEYLLTLRKQN